MGRLVLLLTICAALGGLLTAPVQAAVPPARTDDVVRVKDLGRIQGWRDNALVGYGLVTGLAGTGDSPSNRAARQALSNVLSQFNQSVPADQLQSRNVAVVMVTAALPATAKEGDALDVTVTSAGDARSLVGGTLLLAPLKAANGRVYVLAQGPLAVGGYRYDANGNVVQKNHPTVGSVPGGGVVEVGMPARSREADSVTFVLSQPDYTTADRVANAINAAFGDSLAQARDASGIEIRVPETHRSALVPFIARLEALAVDPDRRAVVVVNERTGTVVSGGDVRIASVVVSHGDLRVSVATENTVSQPALIANPTAAIRTATVSNSRLDVTESNGPGYVAASNTVADLVQALARLRTNTRDVISILRAVKAAGALHADLLIQ
jgi:flagellar P-ring protein FlgI